jgi:hypothetical protein
MIKDEKVKKAAILAVIEAHKEKAAKVSLSFSLICPSH